MEAGTPNKLPAAWACILSAAWAAWPAWLRCATMHSALSTLPLFFCLQRFIGFGVCLGMGFLLSIIVRTSSSRRGVHFVPKFLQASHTLAPLTALRESSFCGPDQSRHSQ
jgi:hypothetical protein